MSLHKILTTLTLTFSIFIFSFWFAESAKAIGVGGTCYNVPGSPSCDKGLNCAIDSSTCGTDAGVLVCSGTCQPAGGGAGGGGCFLPGTVITSSTGGKKIEDIRVGESVTSFNDKSQQILQSRVTDLHKVQRDFYFSIIAGGYNVKVTAEHPFYIGNGQYKEAQYLKTGDVVYVDENNALVYKVVAENVRINEPTSAYNLTVDNSHTFFANNFAVHNKNNGLDCGTSGTYQAGAMYSVITQPDNSVVVTSGFYWGSTRWHLVWGTDYNMITSLNAGHPPPCNGSYSAGCVIVNAAGSYQSPPLDPHVMYFFGLLYDATPKNSSDNWCGYTTLFPHLNQCNTTPNPATINTGVNTTFTTDAYHSSPTVLPYLTPITSVQYQSAQCKNCSARLFVYYSAPTQQLPTYFVVTYYGGGFTSGILPTSYNGYYITIDVGNYPWPQNQNFGGYTYFIPPTYPNYVQNVTYGGDPAYFSTTPASDTSSPYQTVFKGITASFPAATALRTYVTAIGQIACTSSTPVTIKQGATATIVLTPPTAIVPLGGTQVMTATVSKVVGGVVSSVTFTSSNPAVATIAPASDTTSPYNATVTAKAKGSATITASVIIGGVAVASATSVITVPAASATIVLTPPTATVPIGGTQVLTGTVSNVVGGVVTNVTFTSSKPAVATVAPASDTTSPYNATVTGVAVGSATITANVIIGGIVAGSATSVITVPVSSCTVTMSPASATIPVGSSGTYTATVTPVGGTVDQVNFTSGNVAFATVNPASDTTVSYTTQVTGVNLGTTTIRADVIMSGVNRCSVNTSTVTVVPANPWWQVRDSDLQSNGDLTSLLPPVAGTLFDLVGPGGFPGIPSYAGSTSLTPANVSATGWLANSTTVGQKTYDYSYFANQIPAATTINTVNSNSMPGSTLTSGGTLDGKTGYYWYKYDGSGSGLDLTLTSASDMGGRKVVLLVSSASFNINFPINVTDGAGFFMVIVGKNSGGAKGNITVSTSVGGGAGPNLEGLYLADGTFSDGAGATRLSVRGSVVANSANLQRNLGGAANLNPSELFEYAPDQTLLFPSIFGARRINWKEVAP